MKQKESEMDDLKTQAWKQNIQQATNTTNIESMSLLKTRDRILETPWMLGIMTAFITMIILIVLNPPFIQTTNHKRSFAKISIWSILTGLLITISPYVMKWIQ